jgi:hypothetical protein
MWPLARDTARAATDVIDRPLASFTVSRTRLSEERGMDMSNHEPAWSAALLTADIGAVEDLINRLTLLRHRIVTLTADLELLDAVENGFDLAPHVDQLRQLQAYVLFKLERLASEERGSISRTRGGY